MKSTMNEILRKRIEQAAVESRMASAETLTTFGLQSSIDDVVELTEMELSYDEVAESAFEKGAEYALSHQWISVDEALPDDWEYVLVMHKPMSGARNKISIAYLHPTVHSKAWNIEGIECYLNKTNPDDNIVYAWMHIPEVK